MRSSRVVSYISVCAAVALVCACDIGANALTRVPLFPARPVRDVIVYTWPFAIQVGDTMTVDALAYDSSGHLTASQSIRTWMLSDSALAAARSLGATSSSALFRGQRPGALLVRVTIAGVTGQDTMRVIPALAPLQISPASLTLRLGDTAAAKVRIADLNGVPVRNLVVQWNSDDYSVAIAGCCRDSVAVWSTAVGGRTGTTLIRAVVANSVAILPVTVIAR